MNGTLGRIRLGIHELVHALGTFNSGVEHRYARKIEDRSFWEWASTVKTKQFSPWEDESNVWYRTALTFCWTVWWGHDNLRFVTQERILILPRMMLSKAFAFHARTKIFHKDNFLLLPNNSILFY
jgi:hypothetical protein